MHLTFTRFFAFNRLLCTVSLFVLPFSFFLSLSIFIIVYFLFAAIFAQLISSLLHKHLANNRNANWFLPFSCESLTFEFVSMSSFASFPCTIRITSFFSRCFSPSSYLSLSFSLCLYLALTILNPIFCRKNNNDQRTNNK